MSFLLIMLGIIILVTTVFLLMGSFSDSSKVNVKFAAPAFILAFAVGGWFLGVGIVTGNGHDRADAAFNKAAISVFLNVKQLESSNPNASYGRITLQDPTTVVLTQADPSSSSTVPTDFQLPTAAVLDKVNVEGSISGNKSNWCFVISDKGRSAIYNQTGWIAGFGADSQTSSMLGQSDQNDSCTGGIVYDQYGKEQYYTNKTSDK